jgi:hypothetical protein
MKSLIQEKKHQAQKCFLDSFVLFVILKTGLNLNVSLSENDLKVMARNELVNELNNCEQLLHTRLCWTQRI